MRSFLILCITIKERGGDLVAQERQPLYPMCGGEVGAPE